MHGCSLEEGEEEEEQRQREQCVQSLCGADGQKRMRARTGGVLQTVLRNLALISRVVGSHQKALKQGLMQIRSDLKLLGEFWMKIWREGPEWL